MTERIAKCFVTGATGFIGARLVEVLRLYHGTEVRGLVRDYTKLPRLARFPLDCVFGTLLDREIVDRGVAGCDVIFHCAHDFADEPANLVAMDYLIDRALAHGVRRFVYLSSMAVYDPYPDGDLDETHVANMERQGYTKSKADCEQLLLARVRSNVLPAVILQPSGVYGPYAPHVYHWVRNLRQCRQVIPEPGGGLSNWVYVDDVVQAMIRAAVNPAAVGERFLISGSQPVPWTDHFRRLEELAGVRTVVHIPVDEMRAMLQKPRRLRVNVLGNPRQLLKRVTPALAVKAARRLLGRHRFDALKQSLPLPLAFPSAGQWGAYVSRCRVRSDKAKALLGYRPRFDHEAGMRLTAAWAAWAHV
jgi:nucleoside-diphosphate-sugar epimerase